MAERPDNWNIITRYISGKATTEEQQQVEERKIADPDFKKMLEDVQKIWASPAENKKTWNVDEAWERYTKEFGNPYEDNTAKTAAINSISGPVRRSSTHNKQNTAARTTIIALEL